MAQDFGFLSSAWQDLPPRHQSLATVFGHSWRLLTDAEQEVLRQLVVFRGGFRAEAAQAVAGASLALLGELVDKSWLRVSESGRFDLHELIRQFIGWQNSVAADKTDQSEMPQPVAEVFDRHSRYYGIFLQSQEPLLYGACQREVLTVLLMEVDNIRQGWQWAVDHVQVESISKYLKSWQWLGEVRAWNDEMVYLFGEAANKLRILLQQLTTDTSSTAIEQLRLTLARTLYYQARHGYAMQDVKQIETLCQESLAAWPEKSVGQRYSNEQIYVKLPSARADFHQALDLLQKTGALPDLLDTLIGMSQWWLQAGAPETAARVLGFVRQHPSLLPLGQQGATQVYTQLQMMLPEERLVAAQSAGAAMMLDQAVDLASSER